MMQPLTKIVMRVTFILHLLVACYLSDDGPASLSASGVHVVAIVASLNPLTVLRSQYQLQTIAYTDYMEIIFDLNYCIPRVKFVDCVKRVI